MSKLAIRLLNYLGLLDIPEEKIQKYLAQQGEPKRLKLTERKASRRKERGNETAVEEDRSGTYGTVKR
ncbi:MAG: hypothetical protein ACREBU_17815 [Nitrososphaera sp.]